jgi:hypothetical protein
MQKLVRVYSMRSIVMHSGIALGALMLPLACLSVDPVVDGTGTGPGGLPRGGGITKSPNIPPEDKAPDVAASPAPPSCPQSFAPVALHAGVPRAEMCSTAEIQAIADACPLNTAMDTVDCVTARATFTTCASCIFGANSAAGDKPIMLTPGSPPGFQLNQHTCFDYTTGISGCGAQFINQSNCVDTFCSSSVERCWPDRTKSREDCEKSLGFGRCTNVRADEACVAAARAQSSVCIPSASNLQEYTAFFVRFTSLACGSKGIQDAGTD